jgi:hypothetical protein
MDILVFYVLLFSLCVTFGATDDILLRPECGVAFEKVGFFANDMTIWHQTFIIPLSKLDITLTRTVIRPEKRTLNNVTTEYACVAAAIMHDYQTKLLELRATLQEVQKETHMLLRPFDVSRVRHPISENISSCTVDEYKSAVR